MTEDNAELRAKLELAFEAGRRAGAAGGRVVRSFSNGRDIVDHDPTVHAYEDELKAVVNELRKAGVRNVKTHADVLAVKERHGR